MEELFKYVNLKNKYNRMPLDSLLTEFNEFSGQYIPMSLVDDWRFTGLNNIDLLFSDFLCEKGYLNLYEVMDQKNLN